MAVRAFILVSIAVFAVACSPVDALNSIVPTDGYGITKDIPYGKLPRQQLDVYRPDKIKADTPVVVYFYGGSWQRGSKNDYLFVAQGLVSLGYVVVVPDYRLYPEVRYPEFLRDTAQAVAWTYRNIRKYGGNNENLYLIGHSAGAYNAIMMAMNPAYLAREGGSVAWLRGVVGMAGPYDFLPIKDEKIRDIFSTEKRQRKTQPIDYVRARLPRMLLLTGSEDTVVVPENSSHLYRRLLKYGNNVTLKTYDSVGHKDIAVGLATPVMWHPQVREDIRRFINE